MQQSDSDTWPIARRGTVPRRVVVATLAVLVMLLGAVIWAWSHYGAAIFFEMVAAGIAACF